MDILKSKFNGMDIEIVSMPLSKADEILPKVMSGMMKMSIGSFDFFEGLKGEDIRLFQKVLCENVYKFSEKEDVNGVKSMVRSNLSYLDLNDCKKGFFPLLSEFLEFNFGFFSEARRIIEPFIKSQESQQ